jgi:hypothetical protein
MLGGMRKYEHRFHVKLPAKTRQELTELAAEAGLSSSDLVRLSVKWMLLHPNVLLRPGGGEREAA